MRHEVIKPVIQEVNEVIQPYRHVFQRIEPMIEEIKTIVPQMSDNSNDMSDGQWDQPNTWLPIENSAKHNSNSVNNELNDSFGSHLMPNEKQMSRDITKPVESEQSPDDQQRPEPPFDSETEFRDFSESNRRTEYRILPIIIRRSDYWNRMPNEDILRQKIQEIFQFLKL